MALKLLLSALIPMTGDEAYFVVWARHPGLGYYDHPPMVGWLNALLLGLGSWEWVPRLQATLSFHLIAPFAVKLLRRNGLEELRAWWTGITLLLAPLPFIYVISTTDTPLIIFSFFSGYFFLEALRTGRQRDFAAAGVLLGLAFLSKYFAVFLGFTYVTYVLLLERNRRNALGLIVLFACVLPLALLNLYWNFTHSWMTVLFNFGTRLGAQEFSWDQPIAFLGMQVYLATPVFLVLLARQRREIKARLKAGPFAARLFFLFGFPLALFFVSSWKVEVGFHWTFSFYAFLYLWAGYVLTVDGLRRAALWMSALAGLHLVLIVTALLLLPRLSEGNRGLVLHLQAERLAEELRPYAERGIHVATTGYTPSSLLSFQGRFHIGVFNSASRYGRHFDLLDDYSSLDGQEMLIFTHRPAELEDIASYFESASPRSVTLDGVEFLLVHGTGFRYSRYASFLDEMEETYYTPPNWLPYRRPPELLR